MTEELPPVPDQVCATHPSVFDDDCEFCQRDLDMVQGWLNHAAGENTRMGESLTKQGVGMGQLAMMMRLDILTSMVLGQNTKARMVFEVTFQKAVHEQHLQVMKQVRMSKLTQPGPVVSRLDLGKQR